MKLPMLAILCFGIGVGVLHNDSFADVELPKEITRDEIEAQKRPVLERMTKEMLIREVIASEWRGQNAQQSDLFYQELLDEAIKQNIELEKRIKELEAQ